MAAIVTLLNQKGGVGKTSTCFHLSAAIAKTGRRVLLLDNDGQSSLTMGYFGPQGLAEIPAKRTIAALFGNGAAPLPEHLIRPTGFPGVDIVPGSPTLYRMSRLPDEVDPEAWEALRSFVREIRDDYQVVMLDCAPNLLLCSWAALVASTHIIVPLQPEDFGSQGLAPVLDTVAEARKGPNPRLRLAGLLLTMYDKRLAAHQTYEAMLRETYGADVFTNPVPRAKDFIEAVMSRRPLAHYKGRSAAAKAVDLVAAELLERVGLVTEGQGRGAA